MIGIYKITNIINNKIYIGQSAQIDKRIYQHFYDAEHENQNNKNYNTYLHKAIRKYGKINFIYEVIEECSLEDLNQREQYWIQYYKSNNRNLGYNLTKGGEGVCTLDRNLIYQLWDKKLSITEIVEQTSYSRSGIKQVLKSYPNYSPEESNRRRANKRKKKVNQYDLNNNFIQQFNSMIEAAEYTGIRADAISATCRGKQKTSGGFIWKFIQGDE